MSLSVGIVGLPNVGKSTLFNALLSRQAAVAEAMASQASIAKTANYPFTTIEPNVGVVPVPDPRLHRLAEVIGNNQSPNHNNQIRMPPIVPAVVRFVDIAGLIKGASQGEGLGNKFLSHIRECAVIAHVVRVFPDDNIVKEGAVDPKSDFETVKTELELADLETIEKRKDPAKGRAGERRKTKGEVEEELPLLAKKPSLIVLNVGEGELARAEELENEYAKILGVEREQVVAICAQAEEELAELPASERGEYLRELGVEESGLVRLIGKAYKTLGLMSYLTAGETEVRAWTVPVGTTAPKAAGVIHTDFEKKFIMAKVCDYGDFVGLGGWKGAASEGKVRQEGREYVMQEGDVVEFMIGS